jgi:hypothetical protein
MESVLIDMLDDTIPNIILPIPEYKINSIISFTVSYISNTFIHMHQRDRV